ncbi:MAG: tetratricopeptide repeat protein [bacterium]|nr:tetratricopeptide repeat protein [bacterium]
MSIEITESNKAALIDLGLKDGVSLTEIRMEYLEKTSHNRFQRVLSTEDEELQQEFLKYYKAYLTLLKFHSESDSDSDSDSESESESDMDYYPSEQVFQFHLNQGIFYFINQDYLKAGEKFQAAAKINSKNLLVQLYLGVLLLKRKSYYAAEKYFKEAVKINQNSDDAWFYLGESYYRAGEPRKALSMYETAKTLNPGRKELAYRVKEIKEKLGLKKTRGNKKSGKKESFFSRLFKKK